MKTIKDNEFSKDSCIYVKEGIEYSCYSFEYYTNNQEKFAGKDLIITSKDSPIYFRRSNFKTISK